MAARDVHPPAVISVGAVDRSISLCVQCTHLVTYRRTAGARGWEGLVVLARVANSVRAREQATAPARPARAGGAAKPTWAAVVGSRGLRRRPLPRRRGRTAADDDEDDEVKVL